MNGELAILDLQKAHKHLDAQSKLSAEADRAYKIAEAEAYLATDDGTVAERSAHVEVATNQLRYERKLQEDLRVAALEHVRSCRQILSFMQTMMNAQRSVDAADGTTRHGENPPF